MLLNVYHKWFTLKALIQEAVLEPQGNLGEHSIEVAHDWLKVLLKMCIYV